MGIIAVRDRDHVEPRLVTSLGPLALVHEAFVAPATLEIADCKGRLLPPDFPRLPAKKDKQ